MTTATQNGNYRTCTFSAPRDLLDRLDERVTGYGDRSKVIVALIEQFLNNKVTVKITRQERKL